MTPSKLIIMAALTATALAVGFPAAAQVDKTADGPQFAISYADEGVAVNDVVLVQDWIFGRPRNYDRDSYRDQGWRDRDGWRDQSWGKRGWRDTPRRFDRYTYHVDRFGRRWRYDRYTGDWDFIPDYTWRRGHRGYRDDYVYGRPVPYRDKWRRHDRYDWRDRPWSW